jgi:hypothetical protein
MFRALFFAIISQLLCCNAFQPIQDSSIKYWIKSRQSDTLETRKKIETEVHMNEIEEKQLWQIGNRIRMRQNERNERKFALTRGNEVALGRLASVAFLVLVYNEAFKGESILSQIISNENFLLISFISILSFNIIQLLRAERSI